MKILAVDFSNSSIRLSLFNDNCNTVLADGLFERIGFENSKYTFNFNEEAISEEIEMSNQDEAVKILLIKLKDLDLIEEYDEIRAVGHKIIHGGNKYGESVLINEFVISELEKLIALAPLHTSASLKGIQAFQKYLPNSLMIGVFDTGFYQDIPQYNFLYPVPYKWYTNYQVRKYGFNGLNHGAIAKEVKKLLNKSDFKLISCYCDKVVSVSAVDDMKCIDTSMGFTPLSGAMMATRSGDIDSSVIPYVMEKEGKSASEILEDLNKSSGLLGLSEYSNSIFDIIEKADAGDEKCIIAREKYVRRIVDYIAEYYVLLGGVDVIAFSGTALLNSAELREEICKRLQILNVQIDEAKNNSVEGITKIDSSSAVELYVIPTNDILCIAEETFKYI